MNECPIDESGSNEKVFWKIKILLNFHPVKKKSINDDLMIIMMALTATKSGILSAIFLCGLWRIPPCQRQFIKIRYYDIKSKIKVLTSEQTLYYQLLYKFCFSGSIVQNKHCINSSFINCAFQFSQFRISIVLKSVRKLISCSGTTLLANIWRESSTVFMTDPL